jgi:hypothetical protein
MISFFIDLALFVIGVYIAILIAAYTIAFIGNVLVGVVAEVSAFAVGAWSVVRAVVMLDGVNLWIGRTLHAAFSVWVLWYDRADKFDPSAYEALAWMILGGLVLFWFTPWTRELVIWIRGRCRSQRVDGSLHEGSVR